MHTLHTLHPAHCAHPAYPVHPAICTPANSARTDSVYPVLSLNTLHIMHTYTSTPYTLHILQTLHIQYAACCTYPSACTLNNIHTLCSAHSVHQAHPVHHAINTLCTLYPSHCTHHAYTLFILHTLYPTPCTLSPPALCTWCMGCTPLYSEQYTQYKDIYRRTIEMLQSVCIFKANCCLKVHNAHLMLSSPISE